MQAGDALVGIDVPFGVDRPDRAFVVAAHARVAALAVALQPVEHAHAAGDRQRRAQRAHVAAEEPLDEQPGDPQRHGAGTEPPDAPDERKRLRQGKRWPVRLDIGVCRNYKTSKYIDTDRTKIEI